MIPKVKATKTPIVQSVLEDFPDKFMESPNKELYCDLCN